MRTGSPDGSAPSKQLGSGNESAAGLKSGHAPSSLNQTDGTSGTSAGEPIASGTGREVGRFGSGDSASSLLAIQGGKARSNRGRQTPPYEHVFASSHQSSGGWHRGVTTTYGITDDVSTQFGTARRGG